MTTNGSGLSKVAPYYYFPGWWEGGAMLHNFINLKSWEQLTPDATNRSLRTASEMTNAWMLAKYDASNPPALKRLLAQGTQMRPFPTAVMDASLKAATGNV